LIRYVVLIQRHPDIDGDSAVVGTHLQSDIALMHEGSAPHQSQAIEDGRRPFLELISDRLDLWDLRVRHKDGSLASSCTVSPDSRVVFLEYQRKRVGKEIIERDIAVRRWDA
jgi:hypothetical protein